MRKSYLWLLVVLATPGILAAQVDTENITVCDESAADHNFRVGNSWGFSLSLVDGSSPTYQDYSIGDGNRFKWSGTSILDVRNDSPCSSIPAAQDGHGAGYMNWPPTDWDPHCAIDNIGLFRKTVASASGSNANGNWDAFPGTGNIDAQVSSGQSPVWPSTDTYGGNMGYTPVVTRDNVNAAILSPPSSMNTTCHVNDSAEFTCATASAKAVQVFYSGGVSRWFMAFNCLITKYPPLSSADMWRVCWAYSTNGQSWTVDSTMLFRSISEQFDCGAGLVLSEILLDTGAFYLLLTDWGGGSGPDVNYGREYLVRATIDPSATSIPGYCVNTQTCQQPGWSVACYPQIGTYPNVDYSWTPVTLSSQLDLERLNAVSILPSLQYPLPYTVKGATVARVFDTTGDASRYYIVTHDGSGAADVVQLWGTDSLSHPFQFESNVDTTSLHPGQYDWEFGFTHYTNNFPSVIPGGSPRIRRLGPDLWYDQAIVTNYWQDLNVVSRRSVDIAPRICAAAQYAVPSPPNPPVPYCAATLWTTAGTGNLKAFVVPATGATYLWSATIGTITGPATNSSVTFAAPSTSAGTTIKLTLTETQPSSTCHSGQVKLTSTANIQVDFLDVPSGAFHDDIDRLARSGVTSGCGGGNYCPASNLRRDQMSVFLLKGKYGASYAPPQCTGRFTDVPCPGTFTNWVEAVVTQGIMPASPPNSNTFNPAGTVTRADMAGFLIAAQRGPTFQPPVATGTIFTDVHAGDYNAAYIELLYNEGVTGGCQSNPLMYCPNSANNRAQMAVFINKTFRLP
jgi:hypothetical protein